MSFFDHKDFDNHEQVCYFSDEASGFKAIVAIHNTQFGASLGGTRFYNYTNDDDALTDVLRLSRGMTYKSAMARLPLGGGKSVIIGDPKSIKNEALLHAFGDALERLNGVYVAAEDSGTSVNDMKIIHQRTEHVTGYHEKQSQEGGSKSGDPSPATAYGCYLGIKAAVKFKHDRDDVKGLRIGIQGLGNVGYRLAELLHNDGAVIIACDLDQNALAKAKRELGAEIVDLDDIYSQELDIFAPCAMGATVNEHTLKIMNATIIAGSANNQLDTATIGQLLHDQGILYAPDYVINAGGIIDVCYEHLGIYDAAKVNLHIEGIYDTLTEMFERSAKENRPTSELADTIARERLNQGIPILA